MQDTELYRHVLGLEEPWRVERVQVDILERAVARGRKRKRHRAVKKMGVDEKSLGKGHDYLTLIYDLDGATVEHIEDGRRKESLDGYFRLLTPGQRAKIEAIATHIWDPYLASIREHVPARKRGMLSALRKTRLRTARAWALKEDLRALWAYRYLPWAMKHLEAWYGWAIRSLKPVKTVARMFRKYLVNILTFLKHRITNAGSEGLNSTIQTIKKMGYGFRNRDHFKIAILFHCGGLNLFPVTHKNVGRAGQLQYELRQNIHNSSR